jgi:hypothetical protein
VEEDGSLDDDLFNEIDRRGVILDDPWELVLLIPARLFMTFMFF